MRRRATELLPQILLTLLSIIQALALELLWGRIFESDYLFEGGLTAVAGWLQFSAVTIGIVLIWLTYTGQVMRFIWVPRTRDSIFPFAIGLLEFTLIESAGPAHPVAWLVWMAVVFALATFVSNDIFVVATSKDGETPASSRALGTVERWAGLIGAALHLGMAGAVALAGGYGIVAVTCFALVNALLLFQMRMVHLYLHRAITQPETSDRAHGSAASREDAA